MSADAYSADMFFLYDLIVAYDFFSVNAKCGKKYDMSF